MHHRAHRHIVGIIVIVAALGFCATFLSLEFIHQNARLADARHAISVTEAAIKQIKAGPHKTITPTKTTVTSPPKTTTTSPPASTCNTATTHNDPSQIDVLVNKKHCLIPLSYAPKDLVTIDGATLSAKAAPSFDAMYKAAKAAGVPFSSRSSYRSYSTQVTTYNYWVSLDGKTDADTYSARPGFSEHQTGFAVDVEASSCGLACFGDSKQYQWLKVNAADYGFIQRYPSDKEAVTGYIDEEWHYRYVGVTAAKDMQAKGITTLEEYWDMPGGDYN